MLLVQGVDVVVQFKGCSVQGVGVIVQVLLFSSRELVLFFSSGSRCCSVQGVGVSREELLPLYS